MKEYDGDANDVQPQNFEDRIYEEWMKSDCFRAKIDPDKVSFYGDDARLPTLRGKGFIWGMLWTRRYRDTIVGLNACRIFCLWLPGVDHAALATEVKVVEQIQKEGLSKESLGREAFFGSRFGIGKISMEIRIVDQLKKLGSSCDWFAPCLYYG